MMKINNIKCELKYRYWYWPGFRKNYLKFRYCQIYKALKMKGELSK